MRVSKVAKFIVAAIVAGLVALQAAISDGTVTSSEAINVVLVVLGAFGVYAVPNSGESLGRHLVDDGDGLS